jgi:Tfp pilus assembly protein PilX
MFLNTCFSSPSAKRRARQQGVVLVIALIVLIAMTLAGIALMRSVDTSNLIAGNLAFQQAATHSADAGVEDAVKWLETADAADNGSALQASDSTHGYAANGSDPSNNPSSGQSWDAFWNATLAARKVDLNGGDQDGAGNRVSYVIDRMCAYTGAETAGASCAASPVVTTATGNNESTEVSLNAPSVVYYRITVRVAGPRNTVSYVQAMIAL